MPTLMDLSTRLNKTGMDVAKIFPNVRALKGVLDLTGSGAKTNVGIFNALNQTLGASEDAFNKTKESASFQFQASLNSARETMVSLGQQLLVAVIPVVQKMVGFIRNLFNAFQQLEPATKNCYWRWFVFGGFADNYHIGRDVDNINRRLIVANWFGCRRFGGHCFYNLQKLE